MSFIAFAVEVHTILIWSSLVYLDLKNFSFLDDAFGLTCFALEFFIDHFALASTFITSSTLLYHHTRSHLANAVNHTPSTAFVTSCNLGSSFPLTICTDSIALYGYLGGLSVVKIFERHFQRKINIFTFLLSLISTAPLTTI